MYIFISTYLKYFLVIFFLCSFGMHRNTKKNYSCVKKFCSLSSTRFTIKIVVKQQAVASLVMARLDALLLARGR